MSKNAQGLQGTQRRWEGLEPIKRRTKAAREDASARGALLWDLIDAMSTLQRARILRHPGASGASRAILMLDRLELIRIGSLDLESDDTRWMIVGLTIDSQGAELIHEPGLLLEAAIHLHCDDPRGALSAIDDCIVEMIDAEIGEVLIYQVEGPLALARTMDLADRLCSAFGELTKRKRTRSMAARKARKQAA